MTMRLALLVFIFVITATGPAMACAPAPFETPRRIEAIQNAQKSGRELNNRQAGLLKSFTADQARYKALFLRLDPCKKRDLVVIKNKDGVQVKKVYNPAAERQKQEIREEMKAIKDKWN